MRTSLMVLMALGAMTFAETRVTRPVALEVHGRANATPSMAAAGRFVAVAWTASMDRTADVFVAVSRDAGRTFGAPVRVNDRPGDALSSAEQAPRVSVTPVAGKDPMVTVVWATHLESSAILIARSRDGGRTFENAGRVSPPGAAGHRGWPAATNDSHGRSHVVWLDHGNGSWLEYRSSPPAPENANPTPARLAEGVCYCCKTTIAARGDGSIFAAWRHGYPDNIRDIAFVASRDSGRTFDKPLRVSHDEWQINGCPDDGPAMAVDRKGAIHLTWPTVVTAPSERKAVFYSVSRDGRTFSPRLELPNLGSGSASHPSIAAGNDGRIAIVWDERRDIGLVEIRDGRFSRPTPVDASSDGTYPVAAYTSDGLVVAWTAKEAGKSTIALRVME